MITTSRSKPRRSRLRSRPGSIRRSPRDWSKILVFTVGELGSGGTGDRTRRQVFESAMIMINLNTTKQNHVVSTTPPLTERGYSVSNIEHSPDKQREGSDSDEHDENKQ